MKWTGQHIYDYIATFRQGVTMDSTLAVAGNTTISGTATISGNTTLSGNLTFDSVALTGVQTSAESFVDTDISVMTSAAIDDRINTAVTAEDLDVSADSGTAAVDLNSQSLDVAGGTNATTSATGQRVTVNVDDAFLINNGSDTTTGTITAGGFTTTGTWTFDEQTSGTVGITTVQDSGTDFNDNDTSLMTAAAIADKVEAYSYSTNRPTGQLQLTYHNFTDDIATTKIYLSLADADTEGTVTTAIKIPITAPLAGKLMRIYMRANQNHSGNTITWRLETNAAGVTLGTTPTIIGTQSGAGCTTTSITTYDFTSSLDSGDNIIDAGDMVYLSIQSSGATANTKFHITCLWEWDFSSIG